jgi:crotonobetainyl-CoA:carnitine CoA-transferase CaiB-like acyl-CoA transferase
VATLDAVFASKTLAEWRAALADAEGVWAPMQTPLELYEDPQAQANGYLLPVDRADGSSFTLVANPLQFDETPATLRPAPDLGQHTEEVLLELGLTWDDLAKYKESGAIS